MARRAVSGVEAVTRTAQKISGGTLEERVPVKARGDEIDQLATTFNQMLDRIQTLLTEIKEMSDNIAHDLKKPHHPDPGDRGGDPDHREIPGRI